MCRLAAYVGPTLRLKRFLTDPAHSLMKQSWAPKEMREGTVNADGFGVGWFDDDGIPAVYANTCPIWSDPNLEALGRTLESGCWLGNVRSATPGQGISHANTQPFIVDGVVFLHNGFIRGFRDARRAAFHGWLKPEFQAGIRGDTDSEYLFAVFRQCLAGSGGEMQPALLAAAAALPALLGDAPALFNVVVADGETLVACRHAVNGGECPTLYIADDHLDYPEAVLVASERFDGSPAWRPVDPHSWLEVRDGAMRGAGAL